MSVFDINYPFLFNLSFFRWYFRDGHFFLNGILGTKKKSTWYFMSKI